MCFEIPSSKKMYNEIFTVKTKFTNRLRRYVETGWSSQLSLLLWRERKTICTWSWTHANVRAYDIICDGHCSGCKAKIKCEATPKSLLFEIKNFNPDFEHDPKMKRRILSVDLPKLQEKLDGKSVQKLRAEMANDLMNFGDPDPPILPNATAMRKVKSKMDHYDPDPFKSLSFLQKKYPKTIHSIGYDPFFIIYSTPFQEALYKAEVMRSTRTRICIDSTGPGIFFSKFHSSNLLLVINIRCSIFRTTEAVEGPVRQNIYTFV